MITASIRKLGGGNIDNSFACTFRDLVNKTDQILIGIAETHTTAYARFEEMKPNARNRK